MFINCFSFINIFIEHIMYYFGYFCIDLIIKHSVNMKQLFIISVEHFTNNSYKSYLKDFVKHVIVDSSLSIPYSQFADCIRFIFGLGSIIGFRFIDYGKD